MVGRFWFEEEEVLVLLDSDHAAVFGAGYGDAHVELGFGFGHWFLLAEAIAKTGEEGGWCWRVSGSLDVGLEMYVGIAVIVEGDVEAL